MGAFWDSLSLSERARLAVLFHSPDFEFFLKEGFWPVRSNPVCSLALDPWGRKR